MEAECLYGQGSGRAFLHTAGSFAIPGKHNVYVMRSIAQCVCVCLRVPLVDKVLYIWVLLASVWRRAMAGRDGGPVNFLRFQLVGRRQPYIQRDVAEFTQFLMPKLGWLDDVYF